MKSIDFSKTAGQYGNASLVQKSASGKLLELLAIKETDDVLDIGCGPGDLTCQIRKLTCGRVTAIDSAEGMIEEARRKHGVSGISFEMSPAEKFSYAGEFDAIFCNSAFQWFNPPGPVLESCYRALKKQGRMGIQAPAKLSPARKIPSPNFERAIESIRKDPAAKGTFAHFHDPWVMYDTSEEYRSLFESFGFKVEHALIEKVVSFHTPEEVFAIFDTGAAAGFLNQQYYSVPIDENYVDHCRGIVKRSFAEQAGKDGKVELIFYRAYVLAIKS
ncbi:MAG: class I SAM-dependent methyltransferase [Dehalococcoidia bacterium]|nr:class I SAM-dependent methyltransferase [Dehalococcoidia bacterium]